MAQQEMTKAMKERTEAEEKEKELMMQGGTPDMSESARKDKAYRMARTAFIHAQDKARQCAQKAGLPYLPLTMTDKASGTPPPATTPSPPPPANAGPSAVISSCGAIYHGAGTIHECDLVHTGFVHRFAEAIGQPCSEKNVLLELVNRPTVASKFRRLMGLESDTPTDTPALCKAKAPYGRWYQAMGIRWGDRDAFLIASLVAASSNITTAEQYAHVCDDLVNRGVVPDKDLFFTWDSAQKLRLVWAMFAQELEQDELA